MGMVEKDETSAGKKRVREEFYHHVSNLRQNNHRTYNNTYSFLDSATHLRLSHCNLHLLHFFLTERLRLDGSGVGVP